MTKQNKHLVWEKQTNQIPSFKKQANQNKQKQQKEG